MRRNIIIILLLALTVGAAAWLVLPKRPHTLGISIRSHALSPAIQRATVNGRNIIFQSITGAREAGGANYLNAWSDALNFEVSWYDILESRTYTSRFSVDARELSTFSGIGEVADIRITVGPGADVVVNTPDPEEMRLIGLRLEDELRALGYPPAVVLRELCADTLPADDPVAMELEAAHDPDDQHFSDKLNSRERYMRREGLVTPRCLEHGEE